jgi:hypothetical protein
MTGDAVEPDPEIQPLGKQAVREPVAIDQRMADAGAIDPVAGVTRRDDGAVQLSILTSRAAQLRGRDRR